MKRGLWWATIPTVLFAATPAAAWNARGHMIVAALAWKQMGAASRTKAAQLLRLNPDYQTWVKGVSQDKWDEIAFIRAATWPDAIKSKPGYVKDTYDASNPVDRQNIGYGDMNQHRYWHFKDVSFSPDGSPALPPPEINAETEISLLRTALGNSQTSDEIRSYDLAWLLHIVGDVHQPLHATSRFTAAHLNGDGGGNSVLICEPNDQKCVPDRFHNLHAIWDDAFGNSTSAATAAAYADLLEEAPDDLASIDDPATWVEESFELAKSDAYASPIDTSDTKKHPIRLTNAYKARVVIVARKRVILAGKRLANLLDEALS